MTTNRADSLKKLNELIKDVRVAMLTGADADGSLHSRPMMTQQSESDGDLWFFTGTSGHKIDEIHNSPQINVSYAHPDDQIYVSVSGRASIVTDRQKMEELWNPMVKAWFPDGLNDPNLGLLKISVESAEYWDASSSAVVQLFQTAKALVTGTQPNVGENERLDLEA